MFAKPTVLYSGFNFSSSLQPGCIIPALPSPAEVVTRELLRCCYTNADTDMSQCAAWSLPYPACVYMLWSCLLSRPRDVTTQIEQSLQPSSPQSVSLHPLMSEYISGQWKHCDLLFLMKKVAMIGCFYTRSELRDCQDVLYSLWLSQNSNSSNTTNIKHKLAMFSKAKSTIYYLFTSFFFQRTED